MVSLLRALRGISEELEGKDGRAKIASEPHLCHPLHGCLIQRSLPVVTLAMKILLLPFLLIRYSWLCHKLHYHMEGEKQHLFKAIY